MSGNPQTYYINRSTTLLQIDSFLYQNSIVFLSSLNTPGSLITIRDIAGRIHYDPSLPAASNNIITVSTTQGIKFLDGGGPNNNIYRITQPYGFLTVTPKTSTIWGVLNTFAFPDGSTAANIQNLTASSITVSNSYLTNAYISTASISTTMIQSLTASSFYVSSSYVTNAFISLASVSTLSSGKGFITDLQTSSILASTITSSNTFTSNLYAVTATLQSNLITPFIYNSSLQTSSVLASTITSSNTFTSNLYAVTATLQSNLITPFIYNSSLQTSSILASTVTAATMSIVNLTSSNLYAVTATLQSNLVTPFIYNSSLQTSSILASTITSVITNTSNLYAVTATLQSNLITPFIYNSSLQTSSILASTITSSNINATNLLSLSGTGSYGLIYMKGDATETPIMFNDPVGALPAPGFTGWYVGQTPTWGAAGNSFGISRLSGGGAVAATGLWITASGNVGINSPAPTYKLDVNGTANIQTGLSISGAALNDGIRTYNLAAPGGTNQLMGNVILNTIETTGYVSIGGVTTFATNVWNKSSEGKDRLNFGANGPTYYSSGNGSHNFVNSNNSLTTLIINNAGDVTASGIYYGNGSGLTNLPAPTSFGNIQCTSIAAGSYSGTANTPATFTYGIILGTNAILTNGPGFGPGAPPGISGSSVYQIFLAASTGNQNIGVNGLVNQASPHLFAVAVTGASGNTQAVCYGLIMTSPPAASTPPQVINPGQGYNGLTWNVNGVPGSYNVNINTNTPGVGGLYNVVVSVLY